MATTLETTFAGLPLRNPIIVSSSGLTDNAAKNRKLDEAGAGAIVLKSLFEEQIMMEVDHQGDMNMYPEGSEYLAAYLRQHKLDQYLTLIKESKQACSIPVIASINCYSDDHWIDFARQIEAAGADALEVNIFYMNAELEYNSDSDRDLFVGIVRRIKAAVSIPVIVKIGKLFGNIVSLVHVLKVNGADGIVLFNRFFQPDIDLNSLQLVSGNVFSSHLDLSDTLRWTAIVSGKVPGISIASSSGVHDWEDAVKCLLAGADAVQMCSALYTHGPELISQVLVCLEEWMNQKHFDKVSQIKGLLNFANISNPLLYERAQFMKYFSDRD